MLCDFNKHSPPQVFCEIWPLIFFFVFLQVVESPQPNIYKYLPTAHTCSNNLALPIGSLTSKLPNEDGLFEIYDLAFGNTYFGTI